MMNAQHIQTEPLFNFSMDKLPFDVLGLIFSFVLCVPDCKENKKNVPPTATDRFQLNQLAMVSKSFSNVADLFGNVVDQERVLSVLFKVLTLDDPVGDAMDVFDSCCHQLPFSNFSSFEKMIEFAFYFSDNVKHANYAYKWIEYLVQQNAVSPSLAKFILIKDATRNTCYWRTISHLLSETTIVSYQSYIDIQITCRNIIQEIQISSKDKYLYNEAQLYMKNVFNLFKDRFRTLLIVFSSRNYNRFITNKHAKIQEYLTMFDLYKPDMDCKFTFVTDYFFEIDEAKQLFEDKFDFSEFHEQTISMPIILPLFGTDIENFFDDINTFIPIHDIDINLF